MRRRVVWLLIAACAAPPAAAQCRVPAGSDEGKLLVFHTVPVVYSPAEVSPPPPTTELRIGIEGEPLPAPAASLRQTSLCFTSKQENTALTPAFGRPRLMISLPMGFAVDGSFLPTVHVAEATASAASIAASFTTRLRLLPEPNASELMLRAYTSAGSVRGPITCDRAALQQTSSKEPCYGTTPSNDTFRPSVSGLELIAGALVDGGRVSVYAGGGADRIASGFQVGFTDGLGHLDTTRYQLTKPLVAAAVLAGASLRWASRFDAGLQLYSVPAHVTMVRVNVGYWLRLGSR